MGKYHRILVAVDGSAASLHALREAFKISTNWVAVVAVTPFYEGDLRLLGVPKSHRLIYEPCDTALAQAQELADQAGAVITPLCEMGVPFERIVARAQSGVRDLIVMGAKGHGLLEKALVGSVTLRVIGLTDIDVLVIAEKSELSWDRILLATDGSDHGAAAAVRAVDLAQAYSSELIILSVLDLPLRLKEEAPELTAKLLAEYQRSVDEALSRAASAHLKAQGHVCLGSPPQTIIQKAQEEQAGLIVMGSHGRTGLKRLLLGNTAEKVIGHASCPVLVVKERE
jgi:nucleotide-binding universal stress UspA family protein